MENKVATYCISKAIIALDAKEKNFLTPFKTFIKRVLYKHKNENSLFNLEFLQKKLRSDFDIYIPILPLEALVKELCKEDIIEYKPNYDNNDKKTYIFKNRKKIKKEIHEFKKKKRNYMEKYNILIEEFILFLERKFDNKVDYEKASSILNIFLKRQSIYVYADENKLNNTMINISEPEEYMVSKFLLYIKNENSDMNEIIKEITLGYILAESIVKEDIEKDIKKTSQSLEKLIVYLDAPIMFNILGLTPIDQQKPYREFLNELKERKADVKVFTHTINEIKNNLDIAYNYVESPELDFTKITPTTEYYVKRQKGQADVWEDLMNLENRIKELGIEIESVNYDKHRYLHDEEEIYNTILDEYKKNNKYIKYKADSLREKLENDTKSVNGIYVSRGDNEPKTLYDKNSIMVTDNISLVMSIDKYNKKVMRNRTFSPFIMDIDMSIVMWLENPKILESVCYERLLGQIYASFNPSNELLERFKKEIDNLNEKKILSDDISMYLKCDYTLRKNLMDLTWGDIDKVSPKTVLDIKEEIELKGYIKGREEQAKKTKQEKKKRHKNILDSKQKEKKELEKKRKKLEENIESLKKKLNEKKFLYNKKKNKRENKIIETIKIIIFIIIFIILFIIFLKIKFKLVTIIKNLISFAMMFFFLRKLIKNNSLDNNLEEVNIQSSLDYMNKQLINIIKNKELFNFYLEFKFKDIIQEIKEINLQLTEKLRELDILENKISEISNKIKEIEKKININKNK